MIELRGTEKQNQFICALFVGSTIILAISYSSILPLLMSRLK